MVTKFKNNKKILYSSIALFILVLSILIPLGFSEGTDSAITFFDSTNSSAGGQYLKEAIDQMNYYCSKKCPSGKTCKSNTPKCRRATSLHTEICNNSNTSDYCQGAGYASGATITYGNQTTIEGVLTTGDAFDCDVNGDGTFDAESERFYYVSDYYDTSNKSFNDKVAVLIYYSNVKGGVPKSSVSYYTAYDCNGKHIYGPVTAREQLPTINQWSNIRLYKETRAIIAQNNATETIGGTLETTFSYSGYAARLLTYQEVYHGCDNYVTGKADDVGGLDANCQFLLENGRFANNTSYLDSWLETPYDKYKNNAYYVGGSKRDLDGSNTDASYTYGVRPAIEVLKLDISY